MLKNDDTRAAITLYVHSSGQPSPELGWLGHAVIVFATLAVCSLAPTTVSAQRAESTQQPGHRIAVIDVGYIFKNLPEIKAQVSKKQAEFANYKAKRKQKRDTLKQAVAQLNMLKVGTAEYARQEEHVAKLESKLRWGMGHGALCTGYRHHERSDAEVKIYYDNYQRITAAVKAIASHNQIDLVLHFDSQDMDLDDSDSVARGVRRNVVYQDSTINITDSVMRYLEQPTNTPIPPNMLSMFAEGVPFMFYWQDDTHETSLLK